MTSAFHRRGPGLFRKVRGWVRAQYLQFRLRREAKRFPHDPDRKNLESRQFGGWDGVVEDDSFTENYQQDEFIKRANMKMADREGPGFADLRRNPRKED